MKVLITGSRGFIAQNLIAHLTHDKRFEVAVFNRKTNAEDLLEILKDTEIVVHLAGVNRPNNDDELITGNKDLTKNLCDFLESTNRNIPVIFSSSTQATLNNPYGQSKLEAEKILQAYSERTGSDVYIYRLPNVFGKWAKPNYNSVVATFCHNIANGLPIEIDDSNRELHLIYIDDVISEFVSILLNNKASDINQVSPVYTITLGQLAEQIKSFHQSRINHRLKSVGIGLTRALYATYLSYYKPDQFSYKLEQHKDDRGLFAEFLKTEDTGQVSFFTVNPGFTRGGHYHHTKSEKFIVVIGNARFRFRNILTNEKFELDVSEDELEVIETIPGWVHDISNVGSNKMVVLLWANEIFNQKMPDTYSDDVM